MTAGSEKAKSNPFVIGTKNLKLEAIKDQNIKDCASGGDHCGQGTDVHEKDLKKIYSLRVIITYNDFVNNLTALKCVFLQVKE